MIGALRFVENNLVCGSVVLIQLELAHGSAVSFEMHITPNGHAITQSCP